MNKSRRPAPQKGQFEICSPTGMGAVSYVAVRVKATRVLVSVHEGLSDESAIADAKKAIERYEQA